MNEELRPSGDAVERGLMTTRIPRADSLDIPGSLDLYPSGYIDQTEPESQRSRSLTPEFLLRYRWTIVLVAVLVLVSSQTAVWTLITPKYRATALIEIQPIIQKLIADSDEFSPVPFYGQYLATQVDRVKSNDVLDKVLDAPEIRTTNWYRNPRANLIDRLRSPAPPLDRLKSDLVVEVPRNKQVLEVSMACPFPGEASKIVDIVVDQYAKSVTSSKYGEGTERINELNNEKSLLEQSIRNLEYELEGLQQRTELRTPEPKKLIDRRNQELEKQRATADALALEILILDDLIKQHGSATPSNPSESKAAQSQYHFDPRWRVINENIEKYQAELVELRLTMGDGHASVKRLISQIERLKAMRMEQEGLLANSGSATPLNEGQVAQAGLVGGHPGQWRTQRAEFQTRLDHTRKAIQGRTSEYNDAFTELGKYDKVQIELVENRANLQEIKNSLRDINQQRRLPANIRLWGKAFEPQSPSEDKRPKLALAALLGSLGAGLGVAFLRYRLNPKVLDVRDVSHPTVSRILGHLPLLNGQKPFEHAVVAHQQESVRTIRTALMPRFMGGTGQVLQITSAGAGTGKTTFSLMLAESLASCGKRVLLVDADFRRASLSRRLGCGEAPGLCDLLRNAGLTQDQVVVRRPPGVVVLPAGSGHDHQSSELLANGVLARRIKEWRQSFDAVLIDSSPIVPIADGSMLAQQVDGSIVLVREGHCDRRGVADALAQISAVGGQALGVVFVGDRARQHYAYYGSEDASASD